MKICDKCKSTEEEQGVSHKVVFDNDKKNTFDLCQKCYAELVKLITGENPFFNVVGNR